MSISFAWMRGTKLWQADERHSAVLAGVATLLLAAVAKVASFVAILASVFKVFVD